MKQQIRVLVGIDMAKTDHYAQAMHVDGTELFSRPVLNDEATIMKMVEDASTHGRCALVIDMTSSGAQLLLFIATENNIPVAYVTGLQMRRAAELYAGTAKTDPIDAWVLADFARRNLDRLVWLDIGDELLIRLRVLNGRDTDLATDTNRCRDALVSISPALERVVGDRLHQPGIRDALTAWPTMTELNAAGKTRIQNRIKKRSPRLAAKTTDEIWEALESQTVILPAEPTWGEIIAALISDLERLYTQRSALEKTIKEAFISHPLGEVLVSLCGFGPRTGARTLAEIDRLHSPSSQNRFA